MLRGYPWLVGDEGCITPRSAQGSTLQCGMDFESPACCNSHSTESHLVVLRQVCAKGLRLGVLGGGGGICGARNRTRNCMASCKVNALIPVLSHPFCYFS